jgi:hypothetical protein
VSNISPAGEIFDTLHSDASESMPIYNEENLKEKETTKE